MHHLYFIIMKGTSHYGEGSFAIIKWSQLKIPSWTIYIYIYSWHENWSECSKTQVPYIIEVGFDGLGTASYAMGFWIGIKTRPRWWAISPMCLVLRNLGYFYFAFVVSYIISCTQTTFSICKSKHCFVIVLQKCVLNSNTLNTWIFNVLWCVAVKSISSNQLCIFFYFS